MFTALRFQVRDQEIGQSVLPAVMLLREFRPSLARAVNPTLRGLLTACPRSPVQAQCGRFVDACFAGSREITLVAKAPAVSTQIDVPQFFVIYAL